MEKEKAKENVLHTLYKHISTRMVQRICVGNNNMYKREDHAHLMNKTFNPLNLAILLASPCFLGWVETWAYLDFDRFMHACTKCGRRSNEGG